MKSFVTWNAHVKHDNSIYSGSEVTTKAEISVLTHADTKGGV